MPIQHPGFPEGAEHGMGHPLMHPMAPVFRGDGWYQALPQDYPDPSAFGPQPPFISAAYPPPNAAPHSVPYRQQRRMEPPTGATLLRRDVYPVPVGHPYAREYAVRRERQRQPTPGPSTRPSNHSPLPMPSILTFPAEQWTTPNAEDASLPPGSAVTPHTEVGSPVQSISTSSRRQTAQRTSVPPQGGRTPASRVSESYDPGFPQSGSRTAGRCVDASEAEPTPNPYPPGGQLLDFGPPARHRGQTLQPAAQRQRRRRKTAQRSVDLGSAPPNEPSSSTRAAQPCPSTSRTHQAVASSSTAAGYGQDASAAWPTESPPERGAAELPSQSSSTAPPAAAPLQAQRTAPSYLLPEPEPWWQQVFPSLDVVDHDWVYSTLLHKQCFLIETCFTCPGGIADGPNGAWAALLLNPPPRPPAAPPARSSARAVSGHPGAAAHDARPIAGPSTAPDPIGSASAGAGSAAYDDATAHGGRVNKARTKKPGGKPYDKRKQDGPDG
ncbi:uncharacterized protein BXZ73DRAFT_79848 [Epithele typhae]|uniref:uncharacterized protein n=1 Tax=Epithele typhae TaxID=378194 RepID=UPI0020084CE4|nr:uncharacterized protein BXZ73DRAFT_79848 [Epithele typhae]KAH9921706.1 hypothetical protein BXZ73DRAFT_79848 [Epithele typhae]